MDRSDFLVLCLSIAVILFLTTLAFAPVIGYNIATDTFQKEAVARNVAHYELKNIYSDRIPSSETSNETVFVWNSKNPTTQLEK